MNETDNRTNIVWQGLGHHQARHIHHLTDEDFLPNAKGYHHQFRYRTIEGIEFADLVEINTLELRKLPSITDDTDLWDWTKFIKSNDEEEMDMLAEKSPLIGRAVGVLKKLSA